MAFTVDRFDDLIAKTERKIDAQRDRLETCSSGSAVSELIRRALAMLMTDLDTYRAMREVTKDSQWLMGLAEKISPSENSN